MSNNSSSYILLSSSLNRVLTRNQIAAIQSQTKEQRSSDLWHSIRRKSLTASLFGRAFRLSKTLNCAQIKNFVKNWLDSCFADLVNSVAAIRWGVVHEEQAFKDYNIIHLSKKFPCMRLEKSGIWLNDEQTLGASPDGIILDKEGKLVGVLEIKCPYSCRDIVDFKELKRSQFWPRYLKKGRSLHSSTLKQDSDYYYQVQGQIFLTNAKWCDFVVWTPNFMKVERIWPDKEWQKTVVPAIREFFMEYMYPLLLSHDQDRLYKEVKSSVENSNSVNSVNFLEMATTNSFANEFTVHHSDLLIQTGQFCQMMILKSNNKDARLVVEFVTYAYPQKEGGNPTRTSTFSMDLRNFLDAVPKIMNGLEKAKQVVKSGPFADLYHVADGNQGDSKVSALAPYGMLQNLLYNT
jgi:hypothetical protein